MAEKTPSPEGIGAKRRIEARIEKTVQILEDATADGLTGFDTSRLDDLIIRDVAEYLMIKKHRAALIAKQKGDIPPPTKND